MLLQYHLKQWFKPLLPKISLTIFVMAVSWYIGKSTIHPGNIRTFLGLSLVFLLIAVSIRKPNVSILFVIIYLPLMGLIRRALIPIAGWSGTDPLVLIGPVIGLILGAHWFYHRFFLRESFNDTTVFRLVRLMILLDFIEVVNPRQGGLTVGLSSIIFYVAPLFWMVGSRTVVSEKAMKVIMHMVFLMGVVAGLYGLKQTYYGFYPFEQEWISIVKITALKVANLYRAISTTDNPQEYAEFLAQAICVSWLYVLQGRLLAKIVGLIGSGIIGWALFMESARGPLILAAVAISVITVMVAPTRRARLITAIGVALILTIMIVEISHMKASSNALVAHQIDGITGQNSTLSGHTNTMFSGIWRGTKSVIGYGLGSTTTAAGSLNVGTEVDISNMFVSDGLVGGIVYLILMVRILIMAFREAHTRSTLSLFMLGVLCATFEQWVNGELYTAATVLWICVGYADRLNSTRRERTISINQARFS